VRYIPLVTTRLRLEPASYAVVGSREYPRLDLVRAFVSKLPHGSVVISGAARGVDATAEDAGLANGLEVVSFPADWSRGRGAGIARNPEIIAAADIVVAFHDGRSPGTSDSIRRAKEARKRLWICNAMGKWSFRHDPDAPTELRPVEQRDPSAPWLRDEGWGRVEQRR